MRLFLPPVTVPALVGALTMLVVSACGRSHAPVPRDAETDAERDAEVDAGADAGLDGGRDTGVPTCDRLTEAECVGSSACTPLYDDFCCPSCVPIGACADCARPQMYRCAPSAEACPTGECGLADPSHCAGEVPDCARAMVVAGYRCDVPGCVAAIMAGCADDCPIECVPVTGDICTELCDAPQPECPADMTPERDGFCFTGRCIAASACEPAATPAP